VAEGQSLVAGLAGRYATALFELADERKQLDQVAADLAQLKTLLAESADLRRLIGSPVLPRAEQGKALEAVIARAGLGELTRRFIAIAAQNRRLFALPGMIDGFLSLLAIRRGEVTAEVVAAQQLSGPQLDAVKEQLRRAVGSKVSVAVRVDPALLGGLIIKVGSRMVDGSLRTKLQRLQLAMKGV
jgi:F-type H+-transporting ATPase subunit delta